MADASDRLRVFVSYSRLDRTVADQIASYLEPAGFQVLIDRSDLLPGEEWQSELAALIHRADIVLLAVSPNALRSKVCEWEVGEAKHLHKKLVPVVVSPVSLDYMPERLRAVQLFPSEGVFSVDEHGALLVAALNADAAWVKVHTQVLGDEQRWRATGHPNGRLLRGPALSDAADWLTRIPRNLPGPADFVRDFISRSQRAAARRQRVTVVGALAVAAITAGLALLAFDRAQTALAERNRAQEQEMLAEKQRQAAVKESGRAQHAEAVAEQRRVAAEAAADAAARARAEEQKAREEAERARRATERALVEEKAARQEAETRASHAWNGQNSVLFALYHTLGSFVEVPPSVALAIYRRVTEEYRRAVTVGNDLKPARVIAQPDLLAFDSTRSIHLHGFHLRMGNAKEAKAEIEKAMAAAAILHEKFRTVEDFGTGRKARHHYALAFFNRAEYSATHGDDAAARSDHEAAAAIWRELTDARPDYGFYEGLAYAYWGLAGLDRGARRFEDSARRYLQAIEALDHRDREFEKTGYSQDLRQSLEHQASIATALTGRYDEALAHAGRAIELSRTHVRRHETDLRLRLIRALEFKARILLDQTEQDAAQRAIAEADDLATRLLQDFPYLVDVGIRAAETRYWLGEIAWRKGVQVARATGNVDPLAQAQVWLKGAIGMLQGLAHWHPTNEQVRTSLSEIAPRIGDRVPPARR